LEVGSFSYWFDEPWFHTEGRLAAVLITPSSWGSQLGGHLHTINPIGMYAAKRFPLLRETLMFHSLYGRYRYAFDL
jgi:hypothetical protein